MNSRNKKNLLILFLIFISLIFLISYNLAQTKVEGEQKENTTTADYSNINSEVPRNVLIELFINAECTTCPKAAFCLEELAWSYEPGRVILVEAHIWDDGLDIPETNARYDWYVGGGIKGTPDAFFNGLTDRVQGLCCDCGDIDENVSAYKELIDNQLEKTSPLQINAEKSVCGDKFIIQGTLVNKSHTLINNLILGGMLYYEGDDTEQFYLIKEIFDEQDICQFAPFEDKGFSIVSNLDFSNVQEDERNRYYGVIFVQDRLTKEIIQSYLIQ